MTLVQARSEPSPSWTPTLPFHTTSPKVPSGPVIAFASGMAAVAAVFGVTLRPGDVAVLPSDNYYTARVLAQGYFTQMAIHVHLKPTACNAQQQYLHGARLLWLESPKNPGLEGGRYCGAGQCGA